MTSLLVLSLLSCTFRLTELKPEFEGPAGVKVLQKQLGTTGFQVELKTADGKTVWRKKLQTRLESVAFSADGLTIAFDDSIYEVKVIDAKGKLRSARVSKVLTDLEQDNVPRTSCGLTWFGGLSFDASGRVVVTVHQQRGAEPVRVFVDPSNGTLSREKS